MKKAMFLLIALVLLIGCTKQAAQETPEQHALANVTAPIQNATQPSQNVTPSVQTTTETKIESELPEMGYKCRYSAIIYGGCVWQDKGKTSLKLTIASAARQLIPGIWFMIEGENGTKNEEHKEDLIEGGTREYIVKYGEIVSDIGKIVKFDVIPTEISNETKKEVLCYNQRTAFIPENHCKVPAEYNHVG